LKRVVGIDKRCTIPVAAASRVDEVKVGYSWYKTARNGQHRVLLHPRVSRGSEFPNLIGHCGIDPEPAQDIELVIKDRKATGQSYSVTVSGPWSRNSSDSVRERIITKHAISSRNLSAC
jgi:hypothetical protein